MADSGHDNRNQPTLKGGSTVSRSRTYTILGLIGEGGFGRVYRARLTDGDFSKDVAVKMLRDRTPSPELLARFRDEARILALLRDRAVVSVEPPIQLADRWAVVMDFVDGLSMAQINAQIGIVPPAVALEIVAEVARAVDKAYRFPGPDGQPLKLLHRDIKPANIQLTPSGEIRLLDFGTARADFAHREATTVREISGTPGYLAPERLEGIESPAGDVFSLGVTLWAMVTGEGPSRRKYRDLEGAALDLAENDPDLALVLRLAIQMRDRDPERRPPLDEVQSLASQAARQMSGPHLDTWCSCVPHRCMKDDALTGQALTETLQHNPTGPPTLSRVVVGTAGVGVAGLAVASLGAVAAVCVVTLGLLWASAPPAPVGVVSQPTPSDTPVTAPVSPKTTLELQSRPAGAEVTLDGRPLGITPLTGIEVPAGVHRIALKKGMFTAEGDLTFPEGQPSTFLWTAMQGSEGMSPPFNTAAEALRLESDPSGATLSIDGEVRGLTPLDLELPPGEVELLFEKGIFKVSKTITVGPDSPHTYTWNVMAGTEGLTEE